MRILNISWLESTENISIFKYIPNTAPQFLQIKNYQHPKLEHIGKTYIRCPRYSDLHCMSILYSSLALLEITKEQNVSKSSLPKIPKLCPLEHLKLKILRNLRTLKPLKALEHLRALKTLLNHQEYQNHFGWRLKSLTRSF